MTHLYLVVIATGVAHCLCVSETAAVDPIKWDTKLRHYVDKHGRARVFHGVNVVYKESPWYPAESTFTPQTSLVEEDMELLQHWGFNVVRLGVMWPGVEPKANTVGKAYLSAVSKLTEKLAQKGVYTLIDLHQDVGSRRFCGEGFPEHYIDDLLGDPNSSVAKAKPFPLPGPLLPKDSSGYPDLQHCLKRPFATYYMSYQVGAMWRELYTAGTALNAGFQNYWRTVATQFKGAPQVLGYELINEPSGWCLEEFCSPLEPFDNHIEKTYLMPLYKAAAAAIREVDPDHIIFYEPSVWIKTPGTSTFPEPALGNDTQQGLAYHIYCAPGDGQGIVNDLICKASQDIYSLNYYEFLNKFPVAGFMTEFGAIGNSTGEFHHLDRMLRYADNHFQSWAYWQLKLYKDFTTANSHESFYDSNGRLEISKLSTLSRTYAQAIAGKPLKMVFDPETFEFTLDFVATISSAPTEIYLNEQLHYPDGYKVTVQPEDCLTESSGTNRIYLQLGVNASTCIDQHFHVEVTPSRVPAAAKTDGSIVV